MMTDDIRPLDRLRDAGGDVGVSTPRLTDAQARVLEQRVARLTEALRDSLDDHQPERGRMQKCRCGADLPCVIRARIEALLAAPWCANCGREPVDDGQIECAACIQWFADNPPPDTITVSVDEWDALLAEPAND